jgi:acyl carrier protein
MKATQKTLAKVRELTIECFGMPPDIELDYDTPLAPKYISDGFDLTELLMSLEEHFLVSDLVEAFDFTEDDIGDISIRTIAAVIEAKSEK